MDPALGQLGIERVGLWRVENATVEPLDSVSFGGMLQRGVLEPRIFDIPGLLRASLRKTLHEKGYETADLGEFPAAGWSSAVRDAGAGAAGEVSGSAESAGAAEPGEAGSQAPEAPETAVSRGVSTPPSPLVDARLRCRIVSWSARTGSLSSFRMSFRVDVESATSGRRLYGGRFQAYYRESTSSRRTHIDIPRAVRAAARGALAAWPYGHPLVDAGGHPAGAKENE